MRRKPSSDVRVVCLNTLSSFALTPRSENPEEERTKLFLRQIL